VSGGSWLVLGDVARIVKPRPSGDLTSWPRRGASYGGLLTDGAWDYDGFFQILSDCRMTLSRVGLLSADWPESRDVRMWPFVRPAAGAPFDLYHWNPAYFDRLARLVASANSYGILIHLSILELYSWSDRKQADSSVPRASDGPWQHNVNGVLWKDDHTLDVLPDAWLNAFLERVVAVVKDTGVIFQIGNELPEKALHYRIRDAIRSHWPEAQVTVNRQEDIPGMFANMGIGRDFDRLEYHGKRNLGTWDEVFDNGAATDRPATIRQLLDRADTDKGRIIFSSDGCRSSGDEVNTYDWPTLLAVFKEAIRRGCSVDHQSRCKMGRAHGKPPDLGSIEVDFLKTIAAL
jgi:hypothetical protein